MGLFKQFKGAKQALEGMPGTVEDAMKMAGQAQEMAAAQQAAAAQQSASMPAAAAGQAPLSAASDLEPITGVSLELFAAVCKELAAHGYDQSKAAEIAAGKGVPADRWQQALDGWNARVKSNPAVAGEFNRHYHGS